MYRLCLHILVRRHLIGFTNLRAHTSRREPASRFIIFICLSRAFLNARSCSALLLQYPILVEGLFIPMRARSIFLISDATDLRALLIKINTVRVQYIYKFEYIYETSIYAHDGERFVTSRHSLSLSRSLAIFSFSISFRPCPALAQN